jgi:hypothetical protein
VLKYIWKAQLNEKQVGFAHLFFWACFLGINKTVELFLNKIGLSPFSKVYTEQNCVSAAVRGEQYETVKMLV